MIWTDELVDVLKKLWAKGVSASQIAERLGVTRNAVIGKVHRLKLPARAPTPARFRKARTGDMASAKAPKKIEPAKDVAIAKPKPVPEPKPVVVRMKKPMPRNVGLLDLPAGACRWPMNATERGGQYIFCGAAVEEPRVYCPEHCAIAYQRGSAPRRPELGGWVPRETAA